MSFDAFDLLARDDVDHAGDGVRAVDGRGTVFQHFDALDDAHRNGVEIRGAGDAGRGRFVDPADAVDQHQHALGAEVAQVHLRGAGTDATAVGWIAEVARGVELGVERFAAGGHLLQQVADAGEAGAINGRAIDDGQRLLGVGARLNDARAGDHHFLQRFVRIRLLGMGCGCSHH